LYKKTKEERRAKTNSKKVSAGSLYYQVMVGERNQAGNAYRKAFSVHPKKKKGKKSLKKASVTGKKRRGEGDEIYKSGLPAL